MLLSGLSYLGSGASDSRLGICGLDWQCLDTDYGIR